MTDTLNSRLKAQKAVLADLNAKIEEAIKSRTDVTISMSPINALHLSDALRVWIANGGPLFPLLFDASHRISTITENADRVVTDSVSALALIVGDLEDVMERYVGRKPTAMAEVRAGKRAPPRRPQGKYQISEELRQRVLRGEIGRPRPEAWDEELEGKPPK